MGDLDQYWRARLESMPGEGMVWRRDKLDRGPELCHGQPGSVTILLMLGGPQLLSRKMAMLPVRRTHLVEPLNHFEIFTICG